MLMCGRLIESNLWNLFRGVMPAMSWE